MNLKNKIKQFIKHQIILTVLVLLPLLFVGAQNKKGRTLAKEIVVPEGLTYEVHQYGNSSFKRANQLAIAYKEDGVKNKPVVVFIHGGGWSKGDKDNLIYKLFKVAKTGFVGVSISYRLVSEAPFPACIYDVKQAIRYVKSKEKDWSIDIDRIGVWGYSAGAHLALMVGLTPNESFMSDHYTSYASNVKALMVVSAPTDFVKRIELKGALDIFSEVQNNSISFQEKVSPIFYVHKSQVPIYMLHGTKDSIVKPFHYKDFKEECKKKEVENFKLYEFENGKHMFYFKEHEKVDLIFRDFLFHVKSK